MTQKIFTKKQISVRIKPIWPRAEVENNNYRL